MLCDTDVMIMLIDSTKTADWLDGLALKLNKKQCAKFKPSDMMLENRIKLKLRKKQDPKYLESKIASLRIIMDAKSEKI
jgi:hypothetical protein